MRIRKSLGGRRARMDSISLRQYISWAHISVDFRSLEHELERYQFCEVVFYSIPDFRDLTMKKNRPAHSYYKRVLGSWHALHARSISIIYMPSILRVTETRIVEVDKNETTTSRIQAMANHSLIDYRFQSYVENSGHNVSGFGELPSNVENRSCVIYHSCLGLRRVLDNAIFSVILSSSPCSMVW